MLSLTERHRVLRFFRFICILNFFPLRVDLERLEIRAGCGSKCETLASMLSFSFFLAHSLYKFLSFIHCCLFLRSTPLYQVMIHADYAGVAVTFICWYYILHIMDGRLHCQVAELTLTAITAPGKKKTLLHLLHNVFKLLTFRLHRNCSGGGRYRKWREEMARA